MVMKILVTGSAGRVGRAICIQLMKHHDVIGLDLTPCSTTNIVGDICDTSLLRQAIAGVDVIVHTAALHAPHVPYRSPELFQRINVDASAQLACLAVELGVQHFVFTSTTALYGPPSTAATSAKWVHESLVPSPRTSYHHSKISAEAILQQLSIASHMPVTVLQMSRCFPEPADLMAVYRLTRGIDVRDVAAAHLCAVEKRLPGFRRFIISGKTPFQPHDKDALWHSADSILRQTCPSLAADFDQRGWPLPTKLDRVYDSSAAQHALGWEPQYGYESVLQMLDDNMPEVLPVLNSFTP
jgi:UDP-glucose 4-epimerase